MNRADQLRETEIALGAESREQAEAERKNLTADHLAVTVTEFIEWRAFSYWLRLIVENVGFMPDTVAVILQERCPGFLEYAAAYARQHPNEQEFLWLRFLEWTDESCFKLLLLRAGATCSVTMRRGILAWISFERTGSGAVRRGSFSRLRPFRASRVGARPRSRPIDSDLLRFQELGYPEGRVLVEQRPVDSLGMVVKEGLQRIFGDPAVPLLVKQARFDPRPNARPPDV